MTPLVLIHGGGLDARCWDRLTPHLDGPSLAVDLPGRGAHPAPLESVGFADCATTVRYDIESAGFEDVILVGHSLAGLDARGRRFAGRAGEAPRLRRLHGARRRAKRVRHAASRDTGHDP